MTVTLTIVLDTDPDVLAALCADEGCVMAELIRAAVAEQGMGTNDGDSPCQ